jgi:exopolysaccharide production protein ExoQ
MSIAAWPHSTPHAPREELITRSVMPTMFLGTALVVGLAFFLATHDLNISTAVDYTQNAEEMEIAAAGGNALRRISFVMVGGWGLLLLAAGKQRLSIDPLLAGGMSLLIGMAAISFLWADEPSMCLRRLLILACCITAATGFARAFSLREISWLAIWLFGGFAVIGILAELRLGTFRPWADDYRFSGTVHPNTQGPALATLCLAALALARENSRHRVWLWAVFAFAFGLVLLTKSRTAAAAIVAAIAAVYILKTPLTAKCAGTFALVWAAATALLLLWVTGIDPATDFRDAVLLGRADEAETLSGRAFIWPEVLSFANQRFWLGYGYESFWTAGRIETISSTLGWGLREAHNGYLEALLALGTLGLGLMLLIAVAGLVASFRAWRITGDSAYTLPLGLILFGLINAGLESGMVAVTLVPFLLGCCLMHLAFFRPVGRAPRLPAPTP